MLLAAPNDLPRVSAPTTVWLARHGEVHNPDDILYGRLPRWRLSNEGERQADALADFLAPRPLAALYSSPLLRARKTAVRIQSRHPELRVRYTKDLLEIRTGWQGQPGKALAAIRWNFYAHPQSPSDESMEHILARMQRWLRRVLLRHKGTEVVGVSHGDPLILLVAWLREIPMQHDRIFGNPYIPTACVFRLSFDTDGFRDAEMFVPHQQAAA